MVARAIWLSRCSVESLSSTGLSPSGPYTNVSSRVSLELDALKGFEVSRPMPLAVGAAVLVHQLLGVVVGRLGLFGGQLPAQLSRRASMAAKVRKSLQRLVGHIVWTTAVSRWYRW